MDREALEELRQLQKKATAILIDACSRGSLRMCIPAHRDDDDIVIGRALNSISDLIAEVERLTAVVAEMHENKYCMLGVLKPGPSGSSGELMYAARQEDIDNVTSRLYLVPMPPVVVGPPPALQSGGSNAKSE